MQAGGGEETRGGDVGRPRWDDRWWLPMWCALLAVLVMLPLARPGFVLTYDMVTVPEQELTRAALGLGSALPRAVPQDAVLAVLTTVVPGAVVYRAILVLIVFAAALGAGSATTRRDDRSACRGGIGVRVERLCRRAAGDRSLDAAGRLRRAPVAAPAALAVRTHNERRSSVALLLVARSSITPTGGVLASAVLVLVVARAAPGEPADGTAPGRQVC